MHLLTPSREIIRPPDGIIVPSYRDADYGRHAPRRTPFDFPLIERRATVGTPTFAYFNSSDNAPAVTKATGGTSGGIYVICLRHSSSHTVTNWNGFTEVASTSEATIGVVTRVATKAYTGSEGATFTFATSNYAAWQIACVFVSNYDSLVTSSGNSSYAYSNTATLTGANVTTGGTNRLILWFGVTQAGGATPTTPTFTQPTSFTTAGLGDNGNGATMGIASYTEPSSTTTAYSGSTSFTVADSRSRMVVTLVILESGGGPAFIPRQGQRLNQAVKRGSTY